MKVAYFSPLLPKRTGIAEYSHNLLQVLKNKVALALFVDSEDNSNYEPLPIVNYQTSPSYLYQLHHYHICLYHIGNNTTFHASIYKALKYHPGVVVLHDVYLFDLIFAFGKGAIIKEFCYTYGSDKISSCWQILNDPAEGRKYIFLKSIFQQSLGIIVHSEFAKNILIEAGYKKSIFVIPLLCPIKPLIFNKIKEKKKLKINSDYLIIGTFGFVTLNKRFNSICRVLSQLKRNLKFKFLIVGEDHSQELTEIINKCNLKGETIQLGFVSEQEFARYLAMTDIVLNLRYPSLGESSSALLNAMSFGKASIVTNCGWYSELPDDCVYKIDFDHAECDELAHAISTLATNEALRLDMGLKAKSYVEKYCAPDSVADQYRAALLQIFENNNSIPTNKFVYPQKLIKRDACIDEYFKQRVEQIITL